MYVYIYIYMYDQPRDSELEGFDWFSVITIVVCSILHRMEWL